MLPQIHACSDARHRDFILVQSVVQSVVHYLINTWKLPFPSKISHHFEPHCSGHQGIESRLMVDVPLHCIIREALVDFNFLFSEAKVVLHNSHVALAEHAIRKYLLQFSPRVDHVFGIEDVWKEGVNGVLKLSLRVG